MRTLFCWTARCKTIGLALPEQADPSELYLFNGVEQIHLPGAVGDSICVHVVLRKEDGEKSMTEWIADLKLFSPGGKLVGELHGVSLRRTTRQNLVRVLHGNDTHPLLYSIGLGSVARCRACDARTVSAGRMAADVARAVHQFVVRHNVAIYDALLPELDRLSIHHVSTALQALGFDATRGRRFTTEAERTRLGVRAGAHAPFRTPAADAG